MASAIRLLLDGDNCWPDLAAKLAEDRLIHLGEGTTLQVAVLPKGMQSGKPSVALRLELPDGRTVVVETSLALWLSQARAMAARYGWEP